MAEEFPNERVSRFEPLSVLWRVFSAPQTLMVVAGLIALSLVVATVVPQIPLQALDDPNTWLAVQSGSVAAQNSLVRMLHLYDVYHSFWFRLLLVLAGMTLFVWLVDGAELAWRASRRKTWPQEAFAHWRHRASQARVLSSVDTGDALDRVRRFLTAHRYHWAEVAGFPVPNLVASRRGASLWALPVALFAFLAALVGLAIMGTWGWQSADWQPAPGDTWIVGHDSPLRLRLDGFAPPSGETGQPCAYRSQLTWMEGDTSLNEVSLAAGRPVTRQGITVRQVGYVPVARMRATDDAGRPLALLPAGEERSLPGQVDVTFASPEARPVVLVPDENLLLMLAFEPPDPGGAASLQVALLEDGGTRVRPAGAVSESGSVEVDGVRLDLALAYRPLLRVGHRPAMGLLVAGMALGLLALAVGWLWPARLVWFSVAPGKESETLVRMLAPLGPGESRWLPRLAADLREVLSDEH
jgi:hypothetical protein